MSASRSITVVPPGRGFSASLVIAASMCRIRKASPSSLPRMCSTFGMSPTSGCASGSSKRTPPHASTVRAPSPPWRSSIARPPTVS